MKVSLINFMGGDLSVVNAARVSMDKATSVLRRRDVRLLQYLADHGHWTPFAHVMLQYRVEAPIFVARQWFRHQVGFARNEVSRRYVSSSPDIWRPEEIRTAPSEDVKQGSGGQHSDQFDLAHRIRVVQQEAVAEYHYLLDRGVAPEQARAVLPQGAETAWIETASLYAVARLYRERTDPHAQAEIGGLARQLGLRARRTAPYAWRALTGEEVPDDTPEPAQ